MDERPSVEPEVEPLGMRRVDRGTEVLRVHSYQAWVSWERVTRRVRLKGKRGVFMLFWILVRFVCFGWCCLNSWDERKERVANV